MKTKEPSVKGEVIETLSAGRHRVSVEGKEVICYVSGKMQFNKVRVMLGDKVEVVLDPFGGHATNRIVRRL